MELTLKRGDTSLSPRLLDMADTIEKVNVLLEPMLEGTDMFVVSVKVKPTNNIKVFIDADGGFSIEKAIVVNRKLYHAIEAAEMFPDGDFSLEVSSPGIDEPLVLLRQYQKNIGRKLAVTMNDDTEKIGMLKEVGETAITLEIKGKKPTDISIAEIPFADIKKTIVQIIF